MCDELLKVQKCRCSGIKVYRSTLYPYPVFFCVGTATQLVNLPPSVYWEVIRSGRHRLARVCYIVFLMTIPGLFSFIFGLFQTNVIIFLHQINVKNVQRVYSAGIWTLNLQIASLIPLPLDQSSHPCHIVFAKCKCILNGNDVRLCKSKKEIRDRRRSKNWKWANWRNREKD